MSEKLIYLTNIASHDLNPIMLGNSNSKAKLLSCDISTLHDHHVVLTNMQLSIKSCNAPIFQLGLEFVQIVLANRFVIQVS